MNISWGQPTKRRPSHAMQIFPIAFSFITELRQDWRRIYTSRINQWGTEGEREGEGEHEESERKRKSEWWGEKVWLGNEEGLDVRVWVCVCVCVLGGLVLLVSAPSVPVKFYRSSGERPGGAARNRRIFRVNEAGIHGMWHTLGQHKIWPPTCAALHTLSARLATLLWS